VKRLILILTAIFLFSVPAFAAEYDSQIADARLKYYDAQEKYYEALESGDTENAEYYAKAMQEAHDEAERIRSIYGFSGGSSGDDFIQLDDTLNQRDVDYTGPLDLETGEPEGEKKVVNLDELTFISGNMYYDPEEQRYCCEMGSSGDYIYSSMMDGMVTANYAVLDYPEDALVVVYKDGEPYEGDVTAIGERGSYTVIYQEGTLELPLFSFQVISSVSGDLSIYRMPSGFSVQSVTINDEEQYNLSRSAVDMSAEGKYLITYCCQKTGVIYDLKVEVDHTPPTLLLEAVKNGVASGPVDISDVEDGADIEIYYEGKQMGYTGILKDNGDYQIVLFDRAGNRTEYAFHINVYFNVNSIVFILMFIAIVAGVIIYMMKARKKLRVR